MMSSVASAVVFWCGLGLGMVGAGLIELRRISDPGEPIFPRGFAKWHHVRPAVPWLSASVLGVASAGVLRLMGR